MKKIVSCVSLFLALLLVFSACAGTDEFVYPINGDIDFGGEIIYFSSGFASNFIPGLAENENVNAGTKFGDAHIKHVENFKKNYNVKDILPVTDITGDGQLMSLLAGTNKSMFLDVGQATIYNYYKLNLLWAFNDLENVDLNDTDIYGTPSFLKSATFNDGKTYGMKVMGAWNTEGAGNGTVYYNSNLVRQFGAEDPWELYKSGKWTFEKFSAYLDSVCNMNLDNPIYAMEVYQDASSFLYAAIFANGGTLYKEDESGKTKFSMLTDPRTVTAINWGASIFRKDNVTKERQGGDNYFESGEATIFVGSDAIYYYAIENIDNIYFIPFPVGTNVGEGEKCYSTFMSGTRMMCVPADRDNEQAGNFMSLFFSDFVDFPLSERRIRDRRNKFFSDDSYLYYIEASQSVNSNGAGYPLAKTQGAITQALISIGNGQSYNSALSSITNRVQNEIDENINKK